MKNNYGQLPVIIGNIESIEAEMSFSQYYPIKMPDSKGRFERRFDPYTDLIKICACDFRENFGPEELNKSYVYLTVKNMYQEKGGNSFNRHGWHSDGFLTNDINYIWSDCGSTIFNNSDFNLSNCDKKSLKEMSKQALECNNLTYEDGLILRLNQFVIHKVAGIEKSSIRHFVKVSFSRDKYDLKGNSQNHLLNTNFVYRNRDTERNVPQNLEK